SSRSDIHRPARPTLFPSRRSPDLQIAHQLLDLPVVTRAERFEQCCGADEELRREVAWLMDAAEDEALDSVPDAVLAATGAMGTEDRKSTRLNSSHVKISYAVFCLK